MSKHTPGPWFVTGSRTKYVEARIGGGLIQEVAACGPTEADGGYGGQQLANANLIAAAPDLLEAALVVMADLNARIEEASAKGLPVPVFNGIGDLHDAIAKATE